MMHPPFSSVISLDDGSTSSRTKEGFRKIAPTAISWLLYEWIKGNDDAAAHRQEHAENAEKGRKTVFGERFGQWRSRKQRIGSIFRLK